MSQSLLPDILSAEWAAWENVRRDVFQLVAWGYQFVEAEIRQREQEEDITGLLRKGVRHVLDKEPPEGYSHLEQYFAANEDPVDDDGTFGKNRPRLDIMIERSGTYPRRRYRLEGKRCARNVNPIGWYVEGIEAFISMRYAKDSPEGGLLGLVQSDTPSHWKKQLARKLAKDASIACIGSLVDIDLTPDLPEMSVSYHRRSDGSAIALCHAFLDCNLSG